MIGQKGLTDNVIAETELALTAHELIKVKVIADDKEQRSMIVGQIQYPECRTTKINRKY